MSSAAVGAPLRRRRPLAGAGVEEAQHAADLQRPGDGSRPELEGEARPASTCRLEAPEQLVHPGGVDERQLAQVEHDERAALVEQTVDLALDPPGHRDVEL